MIEFIEITTIEYLEEPQVMYDIEVENEHNYIANDYIVHNCITSSNTSTHFPMASLIYEMYLEKEKISKYENTDNSALPKIIADGGIRNYSDVIKALALGADYVMIGSILASCLESAGPTFFLNEDKTITYIDQFSPQWTIRHGKVFKDDTEQKCPLFKTFYGMASKKGQQDISGNATKTAEGIEKTFEVKCSINSWSDNMISYLASAMSYANIQEIKNFNPQNVTTIQLSNNSFNAINK